MPGSPTIGQTFLSVVISAMMTLGLLGCNVVEIEVKSKSTPSALLLGCDGVELEFIVVQDSVVRISDGRIRGSILRFSLPGDGTIDFKKTMTITFIVRTGIKRCFLTPNSRYEAKDIILNEDADNSDSYEIDINRFRKVY
jgi:hypothetical protein